jgi:hypothetical protein
MGISTLDSFQVLRNFALGATTGASAGEFPYLGPVNGIVSLIVSGNFGGGTATMELSPDFGVTWVPAVSNPANLIAPGVLVFQGNAKGIRCKITGATSPNINATVVMVDY